MQLKAALAHARGMGHIAFLLDSQEHILALRTALAAFTAGSLALFVGPEGGLTDDERAMARAAGVQPVSLGPRILRSETAGLMGAALALAGAGNLG